MTFIGNADAAKVISEKVTHFENSAARVYPRSYEIFDSSNPRTRFNDSNGTNLQKFSNISHYCKGWESSLLLVNNPAEYETEYATLLTIAAVFVNTHFVNRPAVSRSFPDGGHLKPPEITRSGMREKLQVEDSRVSQNRARAIRSSGYQLCFEHFNRVP